MANHAASADASKPEDTVAPTSDRRNEIQETVEQLLLEKELAEAIVNLTMQQLSEAEAMGCLSSCDQGRLEQKYSSDLVRVTKNLQKHEKLLTLHELENTQQQLIHAFKAQLQDINQQILRLKDEPQLSELDASDTCEQVEDIQSISLVTNTQKIDDDSTTTLVSNAGSPSRDQLETNFSPAQKTTSSKWPSILLVITIAVFLVSSASYTMGLLSSRNTSNTGTLITSSDHLGVYADFSRTRPLTTIDWGDLAAGEQKTSTVFFHNMGNVSCVLQLNVMNWNPPYLSDHVTVSWDYQGQVLAVDDILRVVFTIVVSLDLENIGAFSYDLVITTFS
jgi:hypothetical protein